MTTPRSFFSDCCSAPVCVAGERTTHWHVCTKCNKACDAIPIVSDRELFIPSKGKITGRRLIGYCKDCKYRDSEKSCQNENFKQGWYDDPDIEFNKTAIIFQYDEGGDFYVGDQFGCIHWEAKQ